MTSGFQHFEGIVQSRFPKHRSGLRRSPSIYRTFEIGTPWRKLSEPKKSETSRLDEPSPRYVQRGAKNLPELKVLATNL
jgi:hypothetical protein